MQKTIFYKQKKVFNLCYEAKHFFCKITENKAQTMEASPNLKVLDKDAVE